MTSAALVASLLLSGCGAPRPKGPEIEVGRPEAKGAEMTLPRLGGGSVSLSKLRGGPVVISLFTTWCLRCQAEAPRLVELHARHRARGLVVLGVALDVTTIELIKTYVEYVGFSFDVLLARPNDLELVGALGVTKQVPRTVLLDGQGKIVDDQLGSTNFDRLRQRIEPLLAAGGRSGRGPPPLR